MEIQKLEYTKIFYALSSLRNVRMIYEVVDKKTEVPAKIERRFKGSELWLINKNIAAMREDFEAIQKTEKELFEQIEEFEKKEGMQDAIAEKNREIKNLREEKIQLPELKKLNADEFKDYQFMPIPIMQEGINSQYTEYIDVLYQYLMKGDE